MNIPGETRRRILEVMITAEESTDANITVESLASQAGMSSKHFQRVFRTIVGETPKNYLRQLRLHHAAYVIKWSDARIIDIALAVGYETHTGFTKAFRKYYGYTPEDFRESTDVVPFLSLKPGRTNSTAPLSRLEPIPVNVRIESLPAIRIAFMRHRGAMEGVLPTCQALASWAQKNDLVKSDTQFIGIHNDYWEDQLSDAYRYDFGVEIPFDFQFDENPQILTRVIPGGKVAMTEFSGSLEDADTAWRQFVDGWLPFSGYSIRTVFAYDRYPAKITSPRVIDQIKQYFTGIEATLCLPIE